MWWRRYTAPSSQMWCQCSAWSWFWGQSGMEMKQMSDNTIDGQQPICYTFIHLRVELCIKMSHYPLIKQSKPWVKPFDVLVENVQKMILLFSFRKASQNWLAKMPSFHDVAILSRQVFISMLQMCQLLYHYWWQDWERKLKDHATSCSCGCLGSDPAPFGKTWWP